VKRGRIGWYGVTSNTFGYASDNTENIALEFLLVCARMVSDNNRFAAIQFPLNLFEPLVMRKKIMLMVLTLLLSWHSEVACSHLQTGP